VEQRIAQAISVREEGNLQLCPTFIVGNKNDEYTSNPRAVSESEGKAFARKISKVQGKPVGFIETSAKLNHNVQEAFYGTLSSSALVA
jgi:Ras family